MTATPFFVSGTVEMPVALELYSVDGFANVSVVRVAQAAGSLSLSRGDSDAQTGRGGPAVLLRTKYNF